MALVTGRPAGSRPPSPSASRMPPYLNGIAEAIGEGRRHALDLLRHGRVERGRATCSAAMDDMYGVLVTIDYPDAITLNLRRSDRRRAQPDREDPRRPVDRAGVSRTCTTRSTATRERCEARKG